MKRPIYRSLDYAICIATVALLAGYLTPAQSQSQWGEPVQITKGLQIGSVQFLRNGKLLVAIKDGVAVINANSRGMKLLLRRNGVRRANMSADGNKIVFDNDLDISTANADGSAFQPVADDPDLFEFAISFTPDGKNITFVTIDDAKSIYGIWIMDPDGGNKQNLLTRTDLAFRHPRKSPNGSKISYFSVGKGTKPRIWVMDSDGKNSVALTAPDKDGVSRQASWSFDGLKFVYSSRKSGDFDIWVMNVDGSGKQRITSIPGDEGKPVWSPAGRSIVFVCSECRGRIGSDLYVISKK